MSNARILRAAIASGAPLSSFGFEHETDGVVTLFWVRGDRAKRPAVISQVRGHWPMAPSADMLVQEHGVTTQLFPAGVDDAELAGGSEEACVRIESQGRSLRIFP